MFSVYTRPRNQVRVYRTGSFMSYLSLPFLAHLSQKLIGELIGYPWSVVVHPQFQMSSPLKPLGQSVKFHVKPP